MSRILILIILVWLLYRVFKHFTAESSAQNKQNNATEDMNKMVLCNQCGLHVPEDETRVEAGRTYCNNPDCKPQKNQHGE